MRGSILVCPACVRAHCDPLLQQWLGMAYPAEGTADA